MVPRPSRVVISLSPSAPIGVTQERIGSAVDQHRAGAALGKAAAELGAVETEIVAQHVEQRRIRLGRRRRIVPLTLRRRTMLLAFSDCGRS